MKAIARADLLRAYGRVLAPSNVTLVVAGDLKRDALTSKLEAAFGAWKAAPVARGTRPGAPKGGDARVVLGRLPLDHDRLGRAGTGIGWREAPLTAAAS